MSFVDRFFYSLDQFRMNFADLVGGSAKSYTFLYTTDVDSVLVAEDNSMVSIIGINGCMKMIGDDEFEEIVDRLLTALRTPLTKKCHAIQFVFDYDPYEAKRSIERQFMPLYNSTKNLGLGGIASVLKDNQDKITAFCANEQIMIAVWTRPQALSPSELKTARKELKKSVAPVLETSSSQGRKVTIERMREEHRSVVKILANAFASLQFDARILSSADAIRIMRKMVAKNSTSDTWMPRLWPSPEEGRSEQEPKKPTPKKHVLPTIMAKQPGASTEAMDNLFPPSIAQQIWPCNAQIVGKKYVEIDGYLYAPIIMERPPVDVKPFNVLYQLLRLGIPWRCSFLVKGGGLSSQFLKSIASQILYFTSDQNKQFNNAYRQVHEASIKNEVDVTFQATFTTWVNCSDYKDPIKEARRRSAQLSTAIQSWGSCDTSEMTGDPLLAFTCTLPGCIPSSPAPAAVAPLVDVLDMLPLFRPCSPWKSTDLPLRTPDGKYMPVGLMSSEQASWNEIIFAAMGQGKSFFLNTLNLHFFIRPQSKLPRVTLIDIGVSGSGLVSLLHASLPTNMRHLAVYAKLKNSKDTAINPFDTPLGVEFPFPNQMNFIVNLISLLCTPLDRDAPYDGVTGMVIEAVKEAYKLHAPKGEHPKRYYPHMDNEITKKLEETRYPVNARTTWWDIVEHLFNVNEHNLAVKAQAYAMPVISDIISAFSSPKIKSTYECITIGNSSETVPAACRRYLAQAMDEYPILSNPTKFTLGTAYVIVLDLQDVTAKGGASSNRKTAIMYMVARHVGASHFFYTSDDLANVPEMYRPYHKPLFESMANAPKRLCYDELHRASSNDENNPLMKQLVTDLTTTSRETRKHNLSICLSSQQLDDFAPALVNLSTNIYILGADNAQQAEYIGEKFGLSKIARLTLRRISRPTTAGANFLAVYRTSKGESLNYLTNTTGSRSRWSFSTTAEDMRVRNKLYQKFGGYLALETLSQQYPGGTIKDELERRRLNITATDGEMAEDIEDEIYSELVTAARLLQAK